MKAIRNLRISVKLSLLLILNTTAFVILGLIGTNAINSVSDNGNNMYQNEFLPFTVLSDFRADYLKIRVKLREAYMSQDMQSINMHLGQAADLVARVDKNSALYTRQMNEHGSAKIVKSMNEFNTLFTEFKGIGEGISKALRSNDKQTAYNLLMNNCTKNSERILEIIASISNEAQGEIQALATNNEQVSGTARRNLLISGIVAGLLAAIFTVLISRFIVGPLRLLVEGAKRMADGDTQVKVNIESKDETGILAIAFNKMVQSVHDFMYNSREEEAGYLSRKVNEILVNMDKFANGDLTVRLSVEKEDEIGKLFIGFNNAVENMKELIGRVAESASYAIDASSQISSATEQLAAGAQQQSSQSTDVAAAMEEMTSTIADNARNSVRAAESARQNTSVAIQGSSVVEQTVEKMRTIAGTVQNAAGTVQRLGEASTQIGEIAGVINDIADQTNLLALNAAIEAARAGEHGRGFAVVADEVRKLAERTSQATKQIAQTIRGIQTETDQAVSMMQRSNTQVTEGIELADKAGNALKQITESAVEVVTLIDQIATASDQQSSTSTEIARNIESISHVSAESARSISDIARTVTELTSVNQEIGQLLGRFRTETGQNSRIIAGKQPSIHQLPATTKKMAYQA
jgi:methyl-accepting chemotaxis protein